MRISRISQDGVVPQVALVVASSIFKYNVSDLKAKINKSLNALEKKVDKVATSPPVSKPTGKPAKIKLVKEEK
ncbi:3571_t:CDS:2 [Funneliformis geosporum]|nr:3571_t:CDS:2 [Funneliformis geosporum]